MSQQRPSPRQAVVAFIGSMSGTITTALGAFIAGGGSAWDAEDAIYAFRDLNATDRPTWLTLETTLANRADPEAALTFVEGLAAAAAQGQPPNPSSGSEADVLAIWSTHLLTNSARRARLRALSRVIASRENPDILLAGLVAAAGAYPAV